VCPGARMPHYLSSSLASVALANSPYPVKQVCVQDKGGYGLKLHEGDYVSESFSNPYTKCLTGLELGKKDGDVMHVRAQAIAGHTVDCGRGEVYDSSSLQSANYRCTGTTLSISCQYVGSSGPAPPPPSPSPAPAPSPVPPPSPRPTPRVAWGPSASVVPEDVGFDADALFSAEELVNRQVNGRQCLLFAKDGSIVYESYSGVDGEHLFAGYSMTKSIGSMLVLYAASQGSLDLDADITEVYGIPSPREYAVSTRFILTQIISSDVAPGEIWEYDSLGSMWLYLLPHIMLSATGRTATDWFEEFTRRVEFSDSFTWENIEEPPPEGGWYTGAIGPCYDWARFAQLIASGGRWGEDQVISKEMIQVTGAPLKAAPYNFYSNPCWGHGFWTNADKEKFPGCCWEASRLPAPMCGEETFLTGAPTDLVMMLGLYGQVVLAVPSVNAVVVSMGEDMRPLEPVRQGVWPAFCSIL